jgi:TRAP-type mannitol/chloroaromatic compound transport system substrate-binding protein
MRVPGIAGEVMKGLGVNVIGVPVSQLKSALSSGKLDAVEFVGPAIDLNLGFADVAKFDYVGWHSPSSEMQFLVNPEAYQKLSKQNKQILKQSMRLAAYDSFIKIVNENGIKMNTLLTEHPNITLRSFPSKVMKALSNQTTEIIDKLIEKSPDGLTKEIAASMKAHKNKSRVWTRFSDQAYLNTVGSISTN